MKLMRTALVVFAAFGIVGITIGCGSSGGGSSTGADGADGQDGTDGTEGTDSTDGTDGTAGSDGTDGANGNTSAEPCNDTSDEEFLAVFGYRTLLPPGIEPKDGVFDVWMMRPFQKYPPIRLTKFSKDIEGKTCEYGCLIDDSLSFIAVNGQPQDKDGFDFQMGVFNDCLNVALNKGAVLKDNAHFEFAQNYIYYSKRKDCAGPSCQYSIYRTNVKNPIETDLLIPLFPPDDDPDWVGGHSTFKGRFRVSPDGESIVIQSPTIRSQRIYLWTGGTLHQVDYLCENFQNDQCIGTGSEYSDIGPIAISPDSKTVVTFNITDNALRVFRYSTENVADKGFSTLLSVPVGSNYRDLACQYRKDWQPTSVIGQPAFTPDGKHVLFIGQSDCTSGAQKTDTDIVKIDPSWIGDLTPVEKHELINLTQNPKGDDVKNNEIDKLAISPDGKRIIFTATPHLNQKFQPMKTTDNSQFNDLEVFKISICGGDKTQLTRNISYKATSPKAVLMPDIADCPGILPPK